MNTLRNALLATTILSGIGSVSLAPSVLAGDATVKAPAYPRSGTLPAVDGLNTTFDLFGGVMAGKGTGGVGGTIAVPINHSYGFQVDGVAARYRGEFMGGVGAHLFWRDPSIGLLGLYGAHTRADFSGVHINHLAAEFESYRGRWTLQGIAGFESGNNNGAFNVKDRFFDKINLNYYLNDNWLMSIGHRYVGGKHALALGTEWALPQGSRTMPSLYVEGRIGEDDYRAAWVGIRFYTGKSDKSLIRRHREDDPINWIPETLFGIINSAGGTGAPVDVCTSRGFPGWILDDGECVPD